MPKSDKRKSESKVRDRSSRFRERSAQRRANKIRDRDQSRLAKLRKIADEPVKSSKNFKKSYVDHRKFGEKVYHKNGFIRRKLSNHQKPGIIINCQYDRNALIK